MAQAAVKELAGALGVVGVPLDFPYKLDPRAMVSCLRRPPCA